MTAYILCLALFSVGVYCMLVKRNIIKIIIGLSITEYAVNLMFALVGFKAAGRSPIYSPTQDITSMVDPIPQALVLTAIVIGLSVTALLVAIAIRLYEKYGTFDVTEIRRLRG